MRLEISKTTFWTPTNSTILRVQPPRAPGATTIPAGAAGHRARDGPPHEGGGVPAGRGRVHTLEESALDFMFDILILFIIYNISHII